MSKLFEPLQVGTVRAQHRVVMAPLTRLRADDEHRQLPFVQEYYSQRSTEPGTLIISEGTATSFRVGSFKNVPGLYTKEHVESWKPITAAVHANGSFIFAQLFAMGRADIPNEENNYTILSSSAIPMDDKSPTPQEMTEAEIQEVIDQFVSASKNAIEAGFDGIEVHGANGYLVDQFTQDNSNQRTDKWGGSVENRSRFGLEITKAVAAAIGADKTAFRISPYSEFQSMRMKDPVALKAQWTYFVGELSKFNLAYLHIVEARINGAIESNNSDSLDDLVEIYGKDKPILIAGGHTAESAKKLVDETFKDYQVAVVFGRYFISNPDLPFKLKTGVKLTPYDRSTFYTPQSPVGYIDYPFSPEFEAYRKKASGTLQAVVG